MSSSAPFVMVKVAEPASDPAAKLSSDGVTMRTTQMPTDSEGKEEN